MSLCSQCLPAFGQHFILNLFLSSSFKWHCNKSNLTETVMFAPPKAPLNSALAIAFFLYLWSHHSVSTHTSRHVWSCVAFIVSAIYFHSWSLLFLLFTLCEKVWLHCPVTFLSAFLYNKAIFSFVLFICHNLLINNLLKVNGLYEYLPPWWEYIYSIL